MVHPKKLWVVGLISSRWKNCGFPVTLFTMKITLGYVQVAVSWVHPMDIIYYFLASKSVPQHVQECLLKVVVDLGSGKGCRAQVTMMPIGTPKVPYRTPNEGGWQWVDIWNVLVCNLGHT